MTYTQQDLSAAAVSRILGLADFKRARPGKHWSNGFQVTGMGTLVEVNYMATRDEDGHAVMERMVEVLNAKPGYVAWLGRPDWMNEIADNSVSVMVRKTHPFEAPAARTEEAEKAQAIEDAKADKKTTAQAASLQALRDRLAGKTIEGTKVVTSERPEEAQQAIQELEIEFDEEHHSIAALALPALRAALDAHPTADFFTKLIGEDDDMVLHVRHFHGTKVRVAAVCFEEMGGTFFTHHSQENFASVADILGHLELFLVGE